MTDQPPQPERSEPSKAAMAAAKELLNAINTQIRTQSQETIAARIIDRHYDPTIKTLEDRIGEAHVDLRILKNLISQFPQAQAELDAMNYRIPG